MEPTVTTTALVVEVPEAEPVVGRWRARLDPYAVGGVPAHVTALFPFVPAQAIGRRVADRAAAAVASLRPFRYEFVSTGWFGTDVLWLAPRHAEPFVRLTRVLGAAFPQHPPYAGAFASVVPHLTVGHGEDHTALERAEAAVRQGLPICGRATHVSLLVLDGDAWQRLHRFPLAGAER